MLDISTADTLRASIVYNPLDATDRKDVDLVFQPGNSLSAYVDDLPDNIEWTVVLDGVIIPTECLALTFPKPDSHVIVTPVPEGGGGGGDNGKAVMALVATIALSVFAPIAGGALGNLLGGTQLARTLATAAVSIAGGVLISAMIPAPENDSLADDQAYGIDGPKNTSSEGIPVPLLFGKHGFGGNIIDLYTENSTDDDGKAIQFLYARTAISEGPIDSVTDVYLNDQEIDTYDDVEWDYRLGNRSQKVSNWFDETITLVNQAKDLTESWQTYTTSQEVDRIRIDFTAPAGLQVTDDRGRSIAVTVPIEVEYRKTGGTWRKLRNMLSWTVRALDTDTSTAFKVNAEIKSTLTDEKAGNSTYSAKLQYRIKDAVTAWIDLDTYDGTVSPLGADTLVWEEADLTDNAWEYQVVITAGTNVVSELGTVWLETPGALNMSDETNQTVRRSFRTPVLKQSEYEIRYKRTTPEQTGSSTTLDKVILSDVGEIIVDKVSLPYTAWLGVKIRLTGQLNQIPTITGVAKGRVMVIYDHNGNATDVAYSNNPADVALNIYINNRYGAQIDKERIDFAAHADWRDHCDANSLTFNAVFYEGGNIDDALKNVYIAGRAQRVSSGAKLSVAIDREDSVPTMMFGSGNMLKNSFSITYLPFADRINDIELSFNDKNDKYKRRTVRVTNDAALARGEALKPATVTLKGITSQNRALKEGVFRMNYNRLVSRVAEWKSPVEAVSCSVGDMIVVQHEMPGWGTGGRILNGTSSQLTLDRDVTFSPGKSYRVVLHQNSDNIQSVNVIAQSSNLITIDWLVPDNTPIRRLVHSGSGLDIGITRILPGTTTTDLLLEERADGLSINGLSAELWNTDVLDDVTVTNPAVGSNVTASVIDLDSNLPSGAPLKYSSYIFGEVSFTKKPFRVKTIGRATDGIVSMSAVEFVPEVYSDDPEAQTHNYSSLTLSEHVTDLAVEEKLIEQEDGSFKSRVKATWNPPATGIYTGAEVQKSVNGERFETVGRVSGERKSFRADAGDVIIVRVVSLSYERNDILVAQGAPTASITIQGVSLAPPVPTNWYAISGPDTITFSGDESPATDFKRFRIYASTAGSTNLTRVAVTADAYKVFRPDPDDNYTRYKISAVDHSGNESDKTAYINIVPIIEAPETGTVSTPTGVAFSSTLKSDGKAKLILTWGAVSGYDVTYDIKIRINGGNDVTVNAGTNRKEWDVLPGEQYHASVRARNVLGERSSYSGEVTHTVIADATPPAVPSGVSLTPGFESIWIEWTPNTESDLSHYEIYHAASNSAPTDQGAAFHFTSYSASFAWTGLGDGVLKYIWVRAVDTSGNQSDWSTVKTTTTLGLISADISDIIAEASVAANLSPVEIVGTLPTTGNFEGRMALLTTDDKLYRYDGSGWTKSVDGGDIISSSITAGTIAAGAIGADQIAVNALVASKVGIGDFTNYYMDPNHLDEDYVSGVTGSNKSYHSTSVAAYRSPRMLRLLGTAGSYLILYSHLAPKQPFNVIEGEEYVFKFVADIEDGTTGGCYVDVQVSASQDMTNRTDIYMSSVTSTSPTLRSGTITIPAGMKYARFRFIKSNIGTATKANFGAVELYKKNAGELIVDGGIIADHIGTNEIIANTANIKNSVVTNAKIADLSAAKLTAGTALASTITVSGTALQTIHDAAADPGAVVNIPGSTKIDPGQITINGGTTLGDWRMGGDLTKIDGGEISANTITANKVTIGIRGPVLSGVKFRGNYRSSGAAQTDRLSWNQGQMSYLDDNGTNQEVSIAAGEIGSVHTSGIFYVYWKYGENLLRSSTNQSTATGDDRIIVCAYKGGVSISTAYGKTVIDGDSIETGSIIADHIVAGEIDTVHLKADSIKSAQIDALAITGSHIAATTVQATKLKLDNLTLTADGDNLRISTGGVKTSNVGGGNQLTKVRKSSANSPSITFTPDWTGEYTAILYGEITTTGVGAATATLQLKVDGVIKGGSITAQRFDFTPDSSSATGKSMVTWKGTSTADVEIVFSTSGNGTNCDLIVIETKR